MSEPGFGELAGEFLRGMAGNHCDHHDRTGGVFGFFSIIGMIVVGVVMLVIFGVFSSIGAPDSSAPRQEVHRNPWALEKSADSTR